MTIILALLLVAQVCAEWVEISQHHYRKPMRTHSPFTTPYKVIDVEDTTRPWTYNNRSVTEYNWNKSPANPHNTGNVNRVQVVGSTVQTNERVKFEEYPELDVGEVDYELRPNYGPRKTTTEFNENGQQKGAIERVPNLGNIKRVQLINTPVKSPTINLMGDREKYSNNRPKNILRDKDLQPEPTEFEDRKTTEPFVRRIYVNKGKKHHGTERTATFPPDDEDPFFTENKNNYNKKESKPEYKNHTAVKKMYSSTMPTFITENEDFINDEYRQNKFYRKPSEVTDNVKFFTTDNINNDEDIFTLNNVKLTRPTTVKPPKNKGDKYIIKDEKETAENKLHVSGNEEKELDDLKTNTKPKYTAPEQDSRSKNRPHKENVKDNKDRKPNGIKTVNKPMQTMENVIKFMRVVADTISTNTRRSFGGKMQYLHELKDTILTNIKERIDSTWPDDDDESASARRYSRSAQESPRGHVHIPSSESALMTISFLTFAVFLIKLVLQVIQTYKHKAMMYAPVVVAASGRNVFTQHGHH